MSFRLALVIPFALVGCTLVLPSLPPRGFNTFNNYHYSELNTSSLSVLLRALSSSPLSAANYSTFFLDGGWSVSTGVFPNGTFFTRQNLDAFGRPVPAPERYPGGLSGVAALARSLGLGFGLWHIRGVHAAAVAAKLPVKGMPQYTLDELVDGFPIAGGKNGSCLWASEWLGVNPLHPAAGAYYASVVEALVEQGATAIKGDCFMCWPCYTGEMELLSAAVKASAAPLLLYLSPGGGNQVRNGSWVAERQIASFYRTVTDFDSGEWYDWGGLQQALFIAGNFSAAGLTGKNGTFADLDMMPLDASFWGSTLEKADRGQTIAALWMMGRFPLFHAGVLPADAKTLSYLTNAHALQLNANGAAPNISYAGNCTCTGGAGSCTIPHGGPAPRDSCVAAWVAAVDGAAWTGVMAVNMGEAPATFALGCALAGLDPAFSYAVSDVWSGAHLGTLRKGATIPLPLRPHASALVRVALIAQGAGAL